MAPHDQVIKVFNGHAVTLSNIRRIERETEMLRKQFNDYKIKKQFTQREVKQGEAQMVQQMKNTIQENERLILQLKLMI